MLFDRNLCLVILVGKVERKWCWPSALAGRKPNQCRKSRLGIMREEDFVPLLVQEFWLIVKSCLCSFFLSVDDLQNVTVKKYSSKPHNFACIQYQ